MPPNSKQSKKCVGKNVTTKCLEPKATDRDNMSNKLQSFYVGIGCLAWPGTTEYFFCEAFSETPMASLLVGGSKHAILYLSMFIMMVWF